MGKLTKAQRDTLVKAIQSKKNESIALSICCSLGLATCLIVWLAGKHLEHAKFFWVLLIVSIFGLGYGLSLDAEWKKMQAQLDEDSE